MRRLLLYYLGQEQIDTCRNPLLAAPDDDSVAHGGRDVTYTKVITETQLRDESDSSVQKRANWKTLVSPGH